MTGAKQIVVGFLAGSCVSLAVAAAPEVKTLLTTANTWTQPQTFKAGISNGFTWPSWSNPESYSQLKLERRPGSDTLNQTVLRIMSTPDPTDRFFSTTIRLSDKLELGTEGLQDTSQWWFYLWDHSHQTTPWLYSSETQWIAHYADTVFYSTLQLQTAAGGGHGYACFDAGGALYKSATPCN